MRINYLELNKYKRFMLNNLSRVKITPKTRSQVILGSNGSGKSSLLKELTPLPADRAEFGKEGSKIISITHRGHDYLLTNDFGKTHIHSFLKDGDELNKGGTITVQKELVRQEFSIRQDTHDFMTGGERFTTMSPSRRREWLTLLCETNYDYALGLYNKVKERSRDTSGALKLAKKRLVVETGKLATEEDLVNLQNQIDALAKEISLLYENKHDEDRSSSEIESRQYALLEELKQVTERLFSLKGVFGQRQIFSEEELRFSIENKRQEVTQITTKIDILGQEHVNLKTALEEYSKAGLESVAGLKDKRESLVKERESLWQRRKLSLEPTDANSALPALESIYELLLSVLSNMPVNEDKRLSQVNLKALEEEVSALKNTLSSSDKRLEGLRHQREHLEQLKAGGDTQCPKCNHRWVIGFTQVDYDKLITIINNGATFISAQKEKLVKLEAEIKENLEYQNHFREIVRCVKLLPILKPFWDHLLNGDFIAKSPANVIRLLGLYKADLDLEIQCKAVDVEISKTDDLIQIALKASNVDMGKSKTRIDAVETELGLLNGQLYLSRNQLTQQMQDCQRVSDIDRLTGQISNYQQLLQKGFNDAVRAIRNEVIQECSHQLQIELAQKQHKLNEIKLQKGIVDDIQKSIDALAVEDTVLKLISDELSPTDGLIAEGLLGFIRSFVRKMNKIIGKVWLYRMEVQDCSVSTDEGAELDYRFPVLIQNADNQPSDVSKCSTGQMDMIDLAFVIVAMIYMGLNDYPLYMDEPTARFDIEHKSNFGNLMKYLVEQCSFSQIYLISHDYVNYGSLSNTDVCVMCKSNIVVPAKYNEHVEMV